MTRKRRFIIFISLLILFILTTPLIICYSLGWRFDWETKKIVQTGAFFFKVQQRDAQIYLNNKPIKKTDFFFRSALIGNLLPKKYEVEIKRDGFHAWKKTLEIKEREATEAKNIVLIPENPNFTQVSQGIDKFFFSPDNKKIIIEEIENSDSENPSWSLKIFETEKNLKSHLIREKDIFKEDIELISLEFSPDAKRVLLKADLKNQPEQKSKNPASQNAELLYFILEIDKIPITITPLNFLEPGYEQIYFHPKKPQALLVQKNGTLFEVDLTNKKTSPPLLDNIISWAVLPNNIYYLETTGLFLKTNFSFDRPEKINLEPFALKEKAEYEIIIFNSYVFLKENEVLYFFDEKQESFQKLFEPVKNLKLSPDSQKLFFNNNHEIWVLFLEKDYGQPQKEAGEKLFLTRYSENIEEVFWYTNHYLIFNLENKIKIVEIDDRDKINIADLIEFKESEIFWNYNNKKLYILSEKTLYASEKLIP